LQWFYASLISHYWWRGKILITKSEYKTTTQKNFILQEKIQTRQNKQAKFIFSKKKERKK
jgi:hypothetical protein